MSDLSARDFPAFFAQIHGFPPYRWQSALLERVLSDEGWPEAIDVPAGFGKTATIDVAVFALAAQAHLAAQERTAPTRVFFVVDRRVIVDQAFQSACLIKRKLDIPSPTETTVAKVSGALRRLSVGTSTPTPLRVVRMRGGVSWGSDWLGSLTQPAVVCATIDQLGSRLLFRGYGTSSNRRPIDAALVGTDRLLLLDEAHLALPFLLTAQNASDEEERLSGEPLIPRRRPRPVLLSATLPLGENAPREAGVLRFAPERETSERALTMLSAERHVRLVDLKSSEEYEMAGSLARAARYASAQQGTGRVLVVCNTVSLARRVFNKLAHSDGGGSHDYESALLIGRCRQAERDLVAKEWLLPPDGRLAAGSERSPVRPVIAVATQTVEVGADLDVDALVTECCPLDALLQRLGRLDRRGDRGTSQAVVIHQAARHDKADDVPLYGRAVKRTWTWLVEHAGRPAVARHAGSIEQVIERSPSLDLGLVSLGALLGPDERAALAAEPPLAPVALGPQFAAWARTSPAPVPDEAVAPYLHGIGSEGPTVQLCWRALCRRGPERDAWRDELSSAPIDTHELVEVPIGEARRFLAVLPATYAGADLEGATRESDDWNGPADGDAGKTLDAWLVGRDGTVARYDPDENPLRAATIVLLPPEAGGHDEWGWTGEPGGLPVPDVGDLAPAHQVRLRREIATSMLSAEARLPPMPSPEDEETDVREAVDGFAAALSTTVDADADAGPDALVSSALRRALVTKLASRLKTAAAQLSGAKERPRLVPVRRKQQGWWVVRTGTRPLFDVLSDDDLVVDGDALVAESGSQLTVDARSSSAPRAVALMQHMDDVARRAHEVATALGLPGVLVHSLEMAGRLHDLGKADPRFQAMLYGGSRLRSEAVGELRAKSGMDPADRASWSRAARLAGWPSGMRHEAISAAFVDALHAQQPDFFDGADFELVLHLVASHHGRSRSLLPPVSEPAPRDVLVTLPGSTTELRVRTDEAAVDWGAPGRFERLGRRYGWWGLAVLESVVRLADQSVSAEYSTVVREDSAGDEQVGREDLSECNEVVG